MKQLLALIMVACSALAFAAVQTHSVAGTGRQVTTFERRILLVERAVRILPCVLADPPQQHGCPSPESLAAAAS